MPILPGFGTAKADVLNMRYGSPELPLPGFPVSLMRAPSIVCVPVSV
jgi:hypothetical protein